MSVLLQRFKRIINGIGKAALVTPKRLADPDVKSLPHRVRPDSPEPYCETFEQPMLETVNEISVYIHRFHNLDLFQQG